MEQHLQNAATVLTIPSLLRLTKHRLQEIAQDVSAVLRAEETGGCRCHYQLYPPFISWNGENIISTPGVIYFSSNDPIPDSAL